MKYFDFQTTTYGKWILAGEHAVLRGHAALVFPIFSKKLTLNYVRNPTLHIEVSGAQSKSLRALFEQVLTHGARLTSKHIADINGHFYLSNHIPIGVGMGASAALCVAVARWFINQEWINAKNLFEFAKELEHVFHGKSSGLDIVGACAEGGQYFQQGEVHPLFPSWQPYWLLSYCGTKSMTSECIAKVQQLWETHPQTARLIDEKMNLSVEKARYALEKGGEEAPAILTESIHQAAECFREWGLVTEPLDLHMQQLMEQGASAAKPTGSGGGGYVLSLWNNLPPIIDNFPAQARIALWGVDNHES